MKHPLRSTFRALFRAPALPGALLLSSLLLLGGCKQDEATPEWTDPPATPTAPAPAPAKPTPAPTPDATPPEEADQGSTEAAENRIRFVSYNLKNYLTMSRFADGKKIDRFKPDEEISAIVQLMVSAKPDVLGICEIGTRDDLLHFQEQLKTAGLDLPHIQHAGGSDDTRHLGLLSRLPISSRNTPADLDYSLQGKKFTMSRGIIDTTIQAGDKKIRFLGVHLKSKREIPDADQELMRRNEAYVLRKHLDTIFAADPDAYIVSYGDFNDTRRNTAIRSAQGAYNSPGFLEALTVKDSCGEIWTHYWDYQHVYSRFDYVMVSKSMRKLVVKDECRILDAPEWKQASDHRPLFTTFEW